MKRTLLAAAVALLAVTTADAAPKTLQVVKDKSSIGFIGRKVVGHHEGNFSGFDGGVVVENGQPKSVDFSIDLATVKTDRERLDAHLKSADFWDIANHPKATFKSSRITRKGDNEYEIEGIFSLRGIQNPVIIPARVERQGDTVVVKSDFKIDRQKWNVAYKGAPDNLISNDVEIKLNLAFPTP